jgi:hypothetical protein
LPERALPTDVGVERGPPDFQPVGEFRERQRN